MFVHVIADFGAMDLAFAEVTQRIRSYLPEAAVHCTTVPPFATIAAGFCGAQLALNEGPADMALFINVAPRRDDPAARRDNAGEALTLVTLKGGRRVVAVDAGYTLSFLAPHAESIHRLAVRNDGSQFRSRDNYPEALARVLRGDATVIADSVAAASVPAPPRCSIAYVDGFGNIKLTLRGDEPLPAGQAVRVSIAGVTQHALVSEGGFAVPQGQLALSVGSSGWHGQRYRELFLRGGSAHQLFGSPAAESEVRIEVTADSDVR